MKSVPHKAVQRLHQCVLRAWKRVSTGTCACTHKESPSEVFAILFPRPVPRVIRAVKMSACNAGPSQFSPSNTRDTNRGPKRSRSWKRRAQGMRAIKKCRLKRRQNALISPAAKKNARSFPISFAVLALHLVAAVSRTGRICQQVIRTILPSQHRGPRVYAPFTTRQCLLKVV